MLPIFNGQKPPMPEPGAAPPQGPVPSGPPQAGPGAPPPQGPGAGGPPPELLQKLMMLKQAQGAGSSDPKGSKYDIDKVSPETSGYMGPENGPFQCGNCVHFEGPNSCGIVAGKVEADGCCNLFNPAGQDQEGPDDNDGDEGPVVGPEPTEPV